MAGALPAWPEFVFRDSPGISAWLHKLGKDLAYKLSALRKPGGQRPFSVLQPVQTGEGAR